jgi:hypothetical protein
LHAKRLNTSEEALSKPLISALSGALSTALGAFIPIIPFFFMSGIKAVIRRDCLADRALRRWRFKVARQSH